jgi:hypothetical protein
VPTVELADVLAPELLHEPANAAGVGGRGQQMDVVVHEHVRVRLAAGGPQRVVQEVAVARAVSVVENAGQAVVAALHDMLRDARKVETGEAGHARRIGRRPRPEHRPCPRKPVRRNPKGCRK